MTESHKKSAEQCCSTSAKQESVSEVSSCCSDDEQTSAAQKADSCCSTSAKQESVSEVSSCCSDDKQTSAEQKADSCCSTPAKQDNEKINDILPSDAVTYNVYGMDCGGCAKTIEKHLGNRPDVQSVDVSFPTGKMKVSHNSNDEEIISQISKIGFKAEVYDKTTKSDTSDKMKKTEYSVIGVTGILIIIGFIMTLSTSQILLPTLLFAAAMIANGIQPVKNAYYAILSKSLDMNVLMSTAAIGAVIIGEWFEGAIIVWLFALGNMLQSRSVENTRRSIRDLMELTPDLALVKTAEGTIEKYVDDITVGEVVLIKAGEYIPLDGTITRGYSSINQSPITGESMPVDKTTGDEIYAGTVNNSGSIEFEVTQLSGNTKLSKIIEMVEDAQEKKAPAEAFIDKFASIYTPVVFIIAFLVILLPPLLGFGDWGSWFYRGLTLLVVACPCALVISTPVAIVSAIGNAAKNGVLIKAGAFLEKTGNINAIAFDKTGTLTEGQPKVASVTPENLELQNLLSIVSTLESHSNHPIATTLVEYGSANNIPVQEGHSFENIPGKGVSGIIEGTKYYAGNAKLFDENNIDITGLDDSIEKLEQEGKTIILIGTEEKALGVISVADGIRETSALALERLKSVGVSQLVMLTGDNKGTAAHISEQSKVDRFFADLLPEDKVSAIEKLQDEGHQVAMVGDGINDAPALATADIGIAMGGIGTDTAMETADIVLMADNLEKLPFTIELSRNALTIIKQNIYFSLIIKAIALILIMPGWLTLWMAVLSDTGAALIVILNSLRLFRVNDSSGLKKQHKKLKERDFSIPTVRAK